MRHALFFVLLAGLAAPAAAQFTLSEDPFRGQPVTVTVPAGADSLVVTYRPGSAIARRTAIPTGGTDAVVWTPAQAGVVALSTADGAAQNVSVRYESAPAGGLFVLIGAAMILFGGAAFAFVKLFSDDRPKPDPARRPDT